MIFAVGIAPLCGCNHRSLLVSEETVKERDGSGALIRDS